MTQALRELQVSLGATLSSQPIADSPIPLSFGNNETALAAAKTGVALYDRSHWGRIQVGDDDRLRFLHNQTTNAFQLLKPGQGCDTVFVTSTGRTIDLATALVLEESVLLLVSPDRAKPLIDWMDRFIFFADKVTLKDVTHTTAAFTLLGAESDALLERLGLQEAIGLSPVHHCLLQLDGMDVRVAASSGLALPGYTLFAAVDQSANLWKRLIEANAIPMGESAWEQLRIEQGRPMPDRELTEDYNPLEAGLWHTISLTKGCYIGQETIARLHTYRGVKQQLWGVRLDSPAEVGSTISAGDDKIGKLTSVIDTADGFLGLAYIRTKAVEPEMQVAIGDSKGRLVALPFVSHEYL